MGLLQDLFSGSVWGGGGHNVQGSGSIFNNAHGNFSESDAHGNSLRHDAHGNALGNDGHGNSMYTDIQGNYSIEHNPPTTTSSFDNGM